MEDYIKATKQKINQLEREISASTASDAEKRNMQHTLSKIHIFSDDVFDDAKKYKQKQEGFEGYLISRYKWNGASWGDRDKTPHITRDTKSIYQDYEKSLNID